MLAAQQINRMVDQSSNSFAVLRRQIDDLRDALAEEMRRHSDTRSSLASERMLRREAEDRAAEERRRRIEAEEMASQRMLNREIEQSIMEGIRLMVEAEEMDSERMLRRKALETAMEERRLRREAEGALRKAVVEYSLDDLRSATGNFDEANKMQEEDGYGALYKGKCGNIPVSIRALDEYLQDESEEARLSFTKEVAFFSRIHHPHIVTLLGACFDKPCLVYEHMAKGNLEHYLSNNGGAPLPWHTRFRICTEIASALQFLHSLPDHSAHGHLKLRSVYLNENLVSKIGDVGMNKLVQQMPSSQIFGGGIDGRNESRADQESDLQAFGIIVLQILTGLPADGVVDDVDEAIERNKLQDILDDSAGEWPLQETMNLAFLSLQFAVQRSNHKDLIPLMMESMERIKECVEEKSENERLIFIPNLSEETPEEQQAPHHFLCPISQEIMENPCIAADGFCYEREHIEAWLRNHDTSPMTNSRLNHQNLTPSNSLRAAIQEWTENRRVRSSSINP